MNTKAARICDQAIAYCLYFLIFCLPFAKAGIGIFTAFAFLFWILKRVFGYRTNGAWGVIPLTQLNKVLGIYIIVNLISVIFSLDHSLSLRGFFSKELKFIVIFFMVVETINTRKRLRNVLITIILSAVLLTVDAGVQYFIGTDFLRSKPWMGSTASFSNANGFAGWLIIVIPLFFGLLTSDVIRRKILKTLLLILTIFLLICLLITFARGAWLGFITGILMIFCYLLMKGLLKIKLLHFIVLLAIIASLIQPIKAEFKTFESTNYKYTQKLIDGFKPTASSNPYNTNLIRINLLKESLQIIKDYPLFGCGLNTYSKVVKEYKTYEYGKTYSYPHNSLLQKAAETGLLGILAFFLILFAFFKTCLQHIFLYFKRDSALVVGLLSGISAFLVHSFFDSNLYALQLVVLFWFMLGLTIAVINLEKQSST